MEITLTVTKNDVYEEVAKTTEYTGKKMDDEHAYEVVSTTEEDSEMLDRFWDESKDVACNHLKKFFVSEQGDDTWELKLCVSSAFDDNLTASMQRSLFSFFVMNIIAKWYTIANKSEAVGYATEAATCMESVMRRACYKKKPERPTYS